MDLTNKRALITGGAVRIGQAITERLQQAGVEVVVHYRNSEEAARTLSPFVVKGDLNSVDACEALLDEAGPLDILINNASIFTKETLAEATPLSILKEFNVNLFAPMELMRIFSVRLQSRQESGAIVNLLDRRICAHDVSCAPYSLSKKSLMDLTQLGALEYAPFIRVNAVAPGAVLPPPDSSENNVKELAGHIPLEQLPRMEQIADAVLFLLQADAVTGQVVYVDGGQHLLGNGV